MPPLVSIITPLYNSERYLRETCDSVLAQTLTDWEWIVVDDGSRDGSLAMAREMAAGDPRILVLESKRNQGAAKARNRAIEAASGRYMAFLDSDDLWMPEKLERQVAFMEESGCPFTYTYFEKMDEGGGNRGLAARPLKVTYGDMLRSDWIGCLTAMYDTRHFGKVFMPDFRIAHDYGLWLTLLKSTPFARCLPEALARYREHPGSLSGHKLRLLWEQWQLFKHVEGLSTVIALRSVLWNIAIRLLRLKSGYRPHAPILCGGASGHVREGRRTPSS